MATDAPAAVSSRVSRPIRVLQLRDSPWVDGPGRTILETTSHIDPRRVEFHVGTFVGEQGDAHPLATALAARGAHVHRIADRRGVGQRLQADVRALMRELDIDVLHSCEPRSNTLAVLCGREAGVRLAATAHGWIANDLRGKAYRALDKFLLRWFDGVIMVSRATRSLVPRWWLPESRVRVLYNALVLESYGADIVNAPRRIADPAKTVTLLNVGRLSPEKGQDLLLQAFARVAKDHPGLMLKFAGIGPLEPRLRALAVELGVVERVEFLSYVKDMPRLYAGIDLIVQSSLTEGLPNVILEGAYLRVPMLATAVGGTAEVVEHARSAWLIPPGSVDALEHGMRRFLAAPAEFAAYGVAGHEVILNRFSFEARTRGLMQFYERLCPELVS
jgi:glycosyltransferase involved in cell wall biosynthesis